MPVSPEHPSVRGEFVWRGRVHLGDEPGIYGDAAYSGLSMQLPIELLPFPPSGGEGRLHVFVEAEEVRVYGPEHGHHVVLLAHRPGASDTAPWTVEPLGGTRLGSGKPSKADLILEGQIPRYLSVQVSIDTTIPPGLYGDIVVTSVSLRSATHYASFGFRPALPPS